MVLWDITLSPTYSAVCGHTASALDRHRVPAGACRADERELPSSFEIGDVGAFALLLQARYLTVCGAETRAGRTMYGLGYSDREVRHSLAESLLVCVSAESSGRQTHSLELYDALAEADFDALFAGIPHQWHTRNLMTEPRGRRRQL